MSNPSPKTILVWSEKRIVIERIDALGETAEMLAVRLLRKITDDDDSPYWQVIEGHPTIEIKEGVT